LRMLTFRAVAAASQHAFRQVKLLRKLWPS
jgi:hypothetical protein